MPVRKDRYLSKQGISILNRKDCKMPQPTPKKVAEHSKRIKNKDGSISTEKSITVGTPAGYVNLPSIVNGTQVSDSAAIMHAFHGGNHSRPYRTIKEATMAARRRSGAIEKAMKK